MTILVLLFCLVPAGVKKLCDKVAWLGKIGPILVLYLIGIIIGNLGMIPFMPECIGHPEGLAQVQDILSSAMVPVAIPLLLFGCTFRRSETRSQLLALLTGLFAVMAVVIAGYFIFGRGIPQGAKIGGMLTGVYTGGTINLASLQRMLDVPEETYILLNSYDMVISFLYLTMLLAVGVKLFRRLLPNTSLKDAAPVTAGSETALQDRPSAFSRQWWRQAGILIGVTAAICGIAAGVALALPDGWFMTVFILLLTTLGIAASFNRKLRSMKIAEDIGMYCIYIFSIVVASMADLGNLDLSGSLGTLGYLTFVIFASLLLQVILAKIFRIDSDTMVVSSVAFICSPPFVPMMSAAMKNKSVLPAGLSIGIVGYAAGNYLGFLIYQLLNLL